MSSMNTAPTSPQSRIHCPVDATSFHLGANSFLLSKTARPELSTPKKKYKRFKQSTRPPSLTSNTNIQQEQLEESTEDVPSSRILEGTVIYIDKNTVTNKDRLTRLAYALSATVINKWTTSATHLVHGSTTQNQQAARTPALVTRSLSHKMRVVAPTWLMDCYEQKKRLPETLYPYEMNPNSRLTPLTAHSSSLPKSSSGAEILEEDENPFRLTPEEFAVIESWSEDDGSNETQDSLANNRRMTDYFQPTTNNNHDHDSNHTGYEDVVDFDNSQHDPSQQPQHSEHENQNNDGDNPNNNTYHGDGDGFDDDNNSMTYSILEMSQAVPLGQQQQQQQHEEERTNETTCAHTNNHASRSNKRQRHDDSSSHHSPNTSSAGQAMERMTLAHQDIRDQQEKKIKYEACTTQDADMDPVDHHDDEPADPIQDKEDGQALNVSDLPDIDPSKLPKNILGREDRLRIWYGEQSFCLDADLTRPNQQTLENNSLPRSVPAPPSKRPVASTLKLSTIKSAPARKIRDYY